MHAGLRILAIQAENKNGLIIEIPWAGTKLEVSNGALKIVKDGIHDAGQWAHENPLLFVAMLCFFAIWILIRTLRRRGRTERKRDFKTARETNGQMHLPFPSRTSAPTSSHENITSHERGVNKPGETQ